MTLCRTVVVFEGAELELKLLMFQSICDRRCFRPPVCPLQGSSGYDQLGTDPRTDPELKGGTRGPGMVLCPNVGKMLASVKQYLRVLFRCDEWAVPDMHRWIQTSKEGSFI